LHRAARLHRPSRRRGCCVCGRHMRSARARPPARPVTIEVADDFDSVTMSAVHAPARPRVSSTNSIVRSPIRSTNRAWTRPCSFIRVRRALRVRRRILIRSIVADVMLMSPRILLAPDGIQPEPDFYPGSVRHGRSPTDLSATMSMRRSSIDWVQASGSRNETLTAMTGASLPRTNVGSSYSGAAANIPAINKMNPRANERSSG
jgi:hypothetical protein